MDERAVRILVEPNPPSSGVSQDLLDTMADVVATSIMQGRSGVMALTAFDQARMAGVAEMQMAATQEEATVDIDRLQAQHFAARLQIRKTEDGFDVFLFLTEARNRRPLPGRSARFQATSATDIMDQIPGHIPQLIGDVDELRRRLDAIENPLPTPRWSSATVAPGVMFEGTITVVDSSTGRRVSNATVATMITTSPASTPIPGSVVTDANGVAQISYPVPLVSPPNFVRLGATITRDNGSVISSGDAVGIIQAAASSVALEKPVLNTNGDSTTMRMEILGAANQRGTLTTVNLNINGPSEVRLDGAGRGRVDVVTDARSGPAEVKLEPIAMPFAHALTGPIVARAYVIKPLDLTAFVEPTNKVISGQILEVRGTVTLEGVPLPAAPVSLELVGEGTLSGTTTSDSNGAYSVFYRAPATGTGMTMVKLSVVKDAHSTERTVTIRYEPPCTDCPIEVVGPPLVGRGGQVLFQANQLVTWSTARGSIDADGRYTAPSQGGTARITATSTVNPAITRTVSIVEACLFNEVIPPSGFFRGDVAPSFAWTSPYDPACPTVKLSFFNNGPQVGVLINEHHQDCAPNGAGLGGSLVFRQPQLSSCTISFTEFGPCGRLAETTLSPDPNNDGLGSRRYSAFVARQPLDGGQCIPNFGATGVLTASP
jgi:hypothetical protein